MLQSKPHQASVESMPVQRQEYKASMTSLEKIELLEKLESEPISPPQVRQAEVQKVDSVDEILVLATVDVIEPVNEPVSRQPVVQSSPQAKITKPDSVPSEPKLDDLMGALNKPQPQSKKSYWDSGFDDDFDQIEDIAVSDHQSQAMSEFADDPVITTKKAAKDDTLRQGVVMVSRAKQEDYRLNDDSSNPMSEDSVILVPSEKPVDFVESKIEEILDREISALISEKE